ncbi:hypothetical protein SETIT_1G282800v2 [Setaria italica]|uniref:Uncharacterized protein n=1 Tax=Setaria italica TaxID=4555 RepID=A0A368PQ37_SETIT|nr:hypothetical protein SETIT_1G282800v2 [Setaria italica]
MGWLCPYFLGWVQPVLVEPPREEASPAVRPHLNPSPPTALPPPARPSRAGAAPTAPQPFPTVPQPSSPATSSPRVGRTSHSLQLSQKTEHNGMEPKSQGACTCSTTAPRPALAPSRDSRAKATTARSSLVETLPGLSPSAVALAPRPPPDSDAHGRPGLALDLLCGFVLLPRAPVAKRAANRGAGGISKRDQATTAKGNSERRAVRNPPPPPTPVPVPRTQSPPHAAVSSVWSIGFDRPAPGSAATEPKLLPCRPRTSTSCSDQNPGIGTRNSPHGERADLGRYTGKFVAWVDQFVRIRKLVSPNTHLLFVHLGI